MCIKLLRIYLYDSGLFDNRIISFSEQKNVSLRLTGKYNYI